MTTSPSGAASSCPQRAPRRHATLLASLLACLLGNAALAQGPATPAAVPAAPIAPAPAKPAKETPPPPPPPPAEGAVLPSVTVEAERPTNRIDRQVYDVKSDVGSTNNSAADALGNVPSVNVDPDGAVTLRGNSNVQILVDGKPSAMLQGENRGAALTAMPADDIESIEVINNPGAQFGNEGGGGPILNLVMRRNKRAGGLGVANANVGANGRYNTALSGTYNEGLYSFQGGINFRHDGRDFSTQYERERIDPVRGTRTRSSQSSSNKGLTDASGVNGGVGYNLGDKDKLAASFSYNKRSSDQTSSDRYLSYGAGNSVLTDYVRSGARRGDLVSYSWGGRFEHKGDTEGELFKLDLRVSSSDNEGDNRYASVYAINTTGAQPIANRSSARSDNKLVDLTGDYELPIERSMLKLGYKVASNDSSEDTRYVNVLPGSGQEVVIPSRTSMFDAQEKNYALYGSYQMRLGERWGVLGGLRAEHTELDIHQQATNAKVSYTSYIPSFFVSYKASDKSNIRLSYAHRIKRPAVSDLNPFVVYRDEFNVASGNPDLKPSESDSLELGYDTQFGIVDTNLRAFYRKETNLISERRLFLSENVLLTTRGNGGESTSTGLEFSFNGKVSKALTLNANGNFAYGEQTNLNSAGVPTKRHVAGLILRGRMNYQISAADSVQLIVNAPGKTLMAQGERASSATAMMSYRRALTPRLNLLFNVSDLFDSNKVTAVTDSDILKDRSVRVFDGRVFYIGLSYRIGGVTPVDRGDRQERGQGMQRRGGMPGGGMPGGSGPGGGMQPQI